MKTDLNVLHRRSELAFLCVFFFSPLHTQQWAETWLKLPESANNRVPAVTDHKQRVSTDVSPTKVNIKVDGDLTGAQQRRNYRGEAAEITSVSNSGHLPTCELLQQCRMKP